MYLFYFTCPSVVLRQRDGIRSEKIRQNSSLWDHGEREIAIYFLVREVFVQEKLYAKEGFIRNVRTLS